MTISPLVLSREAARALLIHAQGLNAPSHPAAAPADRNTVMAAIRRMQVLQIDTINVIARSPYLVLWSRLGMYDPHDLETLLSDRHLFEFWSHEASFLPIEDWPLYRRLMLEGVKAWKSTDEWLMAHPEAVETVMRRIHEFGYARSADFKRTDGVTGNWWNWKDEKSALDRLHTRGDLMIARRVHFHRHYTLRETILPDWHDQHAPPLADVERTLALHAVKALGAPLIAWVADYFRLARKSVENTLRALISEGALIPATIRDEATGQEGAAVIHPDHVSVARDANHIMPTRTTLLSPFDPIVWDRKRAAWLFDFDYKIEVYTPAPRRRYGYFSLPILHHGRLIGRLDPKAHRKEGVFEIRTLHLEPGIAPDAETLDAIAGSIADCARWHGLSNALVRVSNPPEAAADVNAGLAARGVLSA